MNIFEAKLSSEHRKNLPDSEFGLPKERKFPLNDEAHVKSAIKFFKYAKGNQRNELAKNINLKLQKFDMKVTVGKNNPFYNYINRNYLAESIEIDQYVVTEKSFSYIKGTNKNSHFDKNICYLISCSDCYTDEGFILHAEAMTYKTIQENTDTGEDFLLFLHDVNEIFEIMYKEYLNYQEYNSVSSQSTLYYSVVNDFRKTFMFKINSYNEIVDISSIQKAFLVFLNKHLKHNFDHNWYYIYRVNSEIYFNILHRMSRGTEFKDVNLEMLAPEFVRTPRSINIDFIENINMTFDQKQIHFESVKNLLEKQKKELEDELYVIKLDNNIDPLKNESKLHSLYSVDNDELFRRINIISMMMDQTSILFNIVKCISFNIDQTDEIRLKRTKYIDRIISNKLDNGKLYWFGIKANNLYIICKDMIQVDRIIYKLILVDDVCYEYITQPPTEENPKIKIINIIFPINNNIDYDLEQITEGLSINKDGDIKITINPKKSYMNEYMECHRILVENYKNKNYEAMKQNVAFMFLLISIIERDPKYKEREKDIVKARAFAINDFKTYLGYIMKEEPTFNFEKYYRESELDKYVFNIPKETILGIKSLLKSILM